MKLTNYFLPVMKDDPADAQIVSHRLMVRAGLVRQAVSGIYSWLPMGLKVLENIQRIVHCHEQEAGALNMLMPTIQPLNLWNESGRSEDYGQELLQFKDRHGRDMLYGPTNEELITDIFRTTVSSYRKLPLNLYHIQWKFRDEIRPRFGVMRGREFLMKDGYSFDIDEQEALVSYTKIMVSYIKIFEHMGLKAIPMKADCGPIGGNHSHEFLILAEAGETEIYLDRRILDLTLQGQEVDYNNIAQLKDIMARWQSYYARTDETHESDVFENDVDQENQVVLRAIEIGHIFYFGTKYSEIMGARVSDHNGKLVPVHMGSYGIGISRLVGAIIEASHDDKGIIWPESIAPFYVCIVNLKQGDPQLDFACETIYTSLQNASVSVLYDDRNERAGAKFATMDLIGIPWRITVGSRDIACNQVELFCRKNGESSRTSLDTIVERVVGLHMMANRTCVTNGFN